MTSRRPSGVRADPAALESRRGRTRVATAVAAGGLVLSLAGWGWFATEQARAGWWTFGQHVALEPDDRGWAGTHPVRVRMAGVERTPAVDDVQPPAGFHYLALDLEVETDDSAPASTCEVQVRDDQGRLFLAGREVPGGEPYVSWLTCGTSDPEADPVPARQSLLVLVPTDAELVSLRVDARELPPARFIELPLPS